MIFSSNRLFSNEKNSLIWPDNNQYLSNQAKSLIESDCLSFVKRLEIQDPKALKFIERNLAENSIEHLSVMIGTGQGWIR